MAKAILIMPPHAYYADTFKNPYWSIDRTPPIGLLTIGSYLASKGHDVKIIDCHELIVEHKTNDYIPYILKIVDEFKPDVIGINILSALFEGAKEISRGIKERFPQSFIIAGGPHPSVESKLTFEQNQFIDAICVGPGEEVSLGILEGRSNIKGLMLRNGEYEKQDVKMDIDGYPFLNYSLVNSQFYTTLNTTMCGWGLRALPAITSRGCPYSCKFCASHWSKPFRYHSSKYVIEMVKDLTTFDIDAIAFFDDSMASIPKRLNEICDGFLKEKLFYPYTDIRWFCQMRADQVNMEVLKKMKDAGCFGIGLGIESGSDRILKMIDKKTTVEINGRACAYVKEAGLDLSALFMLGLPCETYEDMKATTSFMLNLDCHIKHIFAFKPVPGSIFYDGFVKDGRLKKDTVNWTELVDFSIAPEKRYHDVPRQKFEELFYSAWSKSYFSGWIAVHKNVFMKLPREFKDIATKTRLKIVDGDNYDSVNHIDYRPFSATRLFYEFFVSIYVRLPYWLQRKIRTMVYYIKKRTNKWIWQY